MAITLVGVGIYTRDKKGNFEAQDSVDSDTELVMAQSVEQDVVTIDVNSIKAPTIGGKRHVLRISPKAGYIMLWLNSKSLVVDAIEYK